MTALRARSGRAKTRATAMGADAYEEILGALMQGVAVFDTDARLTFHNPRFIELMDFPDGFVRTGMSFDEVVAFNTERGVCPHGEDAAANLDELAARVHGQAGEFRTELKTPDGHILALRHVRLDSGGFVNTYTRITGRATAESKVRETLELLQSILSNMADGVRVFDAEMKLIAYNDRAFDMMNVPREMRRIGISYEALAEYNRMRGDYDYDHTGDGESMKERMARARSGKGRSSSQHLADGRVIRKQRNHMPGGGFVSTYTDITALMQAEAALKEKARELQAAMDELQRSNAELEQFAYVASHDLQEPLRMVASYCQLLERRLGDKLGEDGKEFIGYAVDGAERMQKLINDLLLYSRVGTRGKEPAPVALGEVMDAAVQNLKVAIDEAGASVTRDELPTVMADDVQMIQLFQNLIGNAVKFHRDVPPEVHVGARETETGWEIDVTDNGIGMKPAYFDRIFLIFQRLHERGKYPGTGIGLAVCKKIVERHGGVITVASEPDRGSTFTFSLPRNGEPA